jgi:hypothetical protein
MKLVTAALAALVIILALGQEARAQTLDLTVNPLSFAYPSGDPDTMPNVSSPLITVTYRVRGNGKGAWHLAVRANGDLVSGPDSIPTTNTTWTGTFGSGTLTNSDQTIASGIGNVNPATTGNITFTLQNLWTYSAGTYTQTIVFTLSVP